jgi:hypothetical protein
VRSIYYLDKILAQGEKIRLHEMSLTICSQFIATVFYNSFFLTGPKKRDANICISKTFFFALECQDQPWYYRPFYTASTCVYLPRCQVAGHESDLLTLVNHWMIPPYHRFFTVICCRIKQVDKFRRFRGKCDCSKPYPNIIFLWFIRIICSIN